MGSKRRRGVTRNYVCACGKVPITIVGPDQYEHRRVGSATHGYNICEWPTRKQWRGGAVWNTKTDTFYNSDGTVAVDGEWR